MSIIFDLPIFIKVYYKERTSHITKIVGVVYKILFQRNYNVFTQKYSNSS